MYVILFVPCSHLLSVGVHVISSNLRTYLTRDHEIEREHLSLMMVAVYFRGVTNLLLGEILIFIAGYWYCAARSANAFHSGRDLRSAAEAHDPCTCTHTACVRSALPPFGTTADTKSRTNLLQLPQALRSVLKSLLQSGAAIR